MIVCSPPELPVKIVEVFDAYDGPRLFTARDAAGRLFLALWVDNRGDESVWLYLPMSSKRLTALKQNQIDLRSAFLTSEDKVVFRVSQPAKGGSLVTAPVPVESVTLD